MVKWNIFEKFKSLTESKDKQENEEPLAQYYDTLQAGKNSINKEPSIIRKDNLTSEQRIWRDVQAIEENIDELKIEDNGLPTSDLNNRVDRLLERKQIKK